MAALAVDCSGSVDAATLAYFMAELAGVLDAYDTTLAILFHDSQVHGPELRTRMDRDAPLTPVGGGGTDYRPVPPAWSRKAWPRLPDLVHRPAVQPFSVAAALSCTLGLQRRRSGTAALRAACCSCRRQGRKGGKEKKFLPPHPSKNFFRM